MNLGCKNCVYWEKFDNDGYGVCRRHAPQPLIQQSLHYDAIQTHRYPPVSWPVTESDDWCSEGKKPEFTPRAVKL